MITKRRNIFIVQAASFAATHWNVVYQNLCMCVFFFLKFFFCFCNMWVRKFKNIWIPRRSAVKVTVLHPTVQGNDFEKWPKSPFVLIYRDGGGTWMWCREMTREPGQDCRRILFLWASVASWRSSPCLQSALSVSSLLIVVLAIVSVGA